MKSYFIYTNDQQQGPFSIQELKDMGINESTPIWKEGFEAWKKAGELAELRTCFEAVPPPYNASYTIPVYAEPKRASSAWKIVRKVVNVLLWIVAIILSTVVAGVIYNHFKENSYSSISYPAPDPEKTNPENYLRTDGTYKKNFWGDRVTIKGTVTNSASHTNYKDVKIRVDFYSRTKSVITSKLYVVYDYFPYGMTKSFELKVDIPSNMETCGWEATYATAY